MTNSCFNACVTCDDIALYMVIDNWTSSLCKFFMMSLSSLLCQSLQFLWPNVHVIFKVVLEMIGEFIFFSTAWHWNFLPWNKWRISKDMRHIGTERWTVNHNKQPLNLLWVRDWTCSSDCRYYSRKEKISFVKRIHVFWLQILQYFIFPCCSVSA